MHHSEYLTDVLIFLAASVIIVPIFRRFKASPILGYLAAGMVIGPYGFGLIGETEAAHTLAEFGVVFLLFMIGLEFSVARLKALRSTVLGLGSLQVAITGLVIFATAYAIGLTVPAAVVIGGGLALSSTAFVLQLLTERDERRTRFGLTAFSVLLLQDIAVVPLLILVAVLGNAEASASQILLLIVIKGGLSVICVLLFGRYLLQPLFKVIAAQRSSELFFAATLLVVLGTGWVVSLAGLSMEMGALLAGLILAETQYKHQVEADIRPFKGILLGLFFMTIGMSVNISFIFENWMLIGGLALGLLAAKTLITTALCRLVGIPTGISIKTGFALSQGGEFGFVLFGAALAIGVLGESTGQTLLAVIALTMAATPLMFYFGDQLGLLWESQFGNKQGGIELHDGMMSEHVLIAGFGRVGQTVSRVLSDTGIPYIALDLDETRVTKCRAKGMSVFYGDADQIAVLKAAGADLAIAAVITIDQKDEASRIVTALRKAYPELPVYVRSRDNQHSRELEDKGATEIVSEAAESSLQLGSIVLSSLGVSQDEIATLVQDYRQDDYVRLSEIIGGR